jgi:hypothetical protein
MKLKSLFQMMYYIIHNGRKKTPLHVMTAHHIYDKCKSRELITSLNRTGVCISYNEIQRARSNLAYYAYLSSEKSDVPLPSHFSVDEFTIAAFDNFDHADQSSPSGMMSNHDTVMTLFQVKPDHSPTKPTVSSVDLVKARRTSASKLPCQEIIPFCSQKKDLSLPSSFAVEKCSMEYPEKRLKENNIEFVYTCLKGFLRSETDDEIPTWAAFRSLISSGNVPVMQVGFLPYLRCIRHCTTLGKF